MTDKSYIDNVQSTNRDEISSENDAGELWETTVDPALYADCDKIPRTSESKEQWAAAAYEDCDNSMHNNHDDSMTHKTA